ncbi:MAG: DUF4139 domain-containing protein [Bacteroidota bacterium]
MKKLWLPGLALFVGISASSAQNGLKTTELNVFKNGTYFVVKEGEVQIDDGISKLEIPKTPLLGTFWLTTAKDASISKIVFMTDTLKSNRPARTIIDLIKANKDKKIRLNYRIDDKSYGEISGTMMAFYEVSSLIKLKTAEGKYAYIPAADVRHFFVDEVPSEVLKNDSTAYLARVEFNKNSGTSRLKMVYMQAGIQWIPSYNIKVINDKELQIEMRALVENFAEVIKDADLTLTVGNPNYKFGMAIEPFVNPFLTNLGGQASATPKAYMYQNAPMRASMMAESSVAAGADNFQDYQVYDTEGEKTNDLFMFKLGKVSIPKNSKATFPVFSQKLPYKDTYKVSLFDVINYAGNRTIFNNPDQKFDVFHSLKLTNTTKNPLTTAPVFVMDESLRPLAQDEIKYTAPGDVVNVNLSKSPDIIVKNTEEEQAREEKAKVIDKNTFNKITIKGSITVQNLLDKPLTLNVDKTVTAIMTDVSDKGNIRKPARYNGLNPTSVAEWELSLGSGEKKTLTYTYEVYVNARY